MTEMVERVARAIFAAIEPVSNWDDEGERSQEQWRLEARAAIAAMREPTEEMKTCSDEIHWGYSCHVCGGLTEGWHKMIDAALR